MKPNIDTRWKLGYLGLLGNIDDLGVANGGSTRNYGGGKVMTNSAPTFEETLSEITKHVQREEYMVVICTFAQDSYDYNRDNGGWEQRISEICANNSAVIDASDLDQKTVVKDVLGKVIVIVNTENSVYLCLTGTDILKNTGATGLSPSIPNILRYF